MASSQLPKFATVASKASNELLKQISSHPGLLPNASGLLEVLSDLVKSLDLLAKFEIQLDILCLPLLRCAIACTEIVSYYTQHSIDSNSVRQAQYLIYNASGMRYLLAAYNSTIQVVLASINL
jgi:hypothetical protein